MMKAAVRMKDEASREISSRAAQPMKLRKIMAIVDVTALMGSRKRSGFPREPIHLSVIGISDVTAPAGHFAGVAAGSRDPRGRPDAFSGM